jgi:hypothetical protein
MTVLLKNCAVASSKLPSQGLPRPHFPLELQVGNRELTTDVGGHHEDDMMVMEFGLEDWLNCCGEYGGEGHSGHS